MKFFPFLVMAARRVLGCFAARCLILIQLLRSIGGRRIARVCLSAPPRHWLHQLVAIGEHDNNVLRARRAILESRIVRLTAEADKLETQVINLDGEIALHRHQVTRANYWK